MPANLPSAAAGGGDSGTSGKLVSDIATRGETDSGEPSPGNGGSQGAGSARWRRLKRVRAFAEKFVRVLTEKAPVFALPAPEIAPAHKVRQSHHALMEAYRRVISVTASRANQKDRGDGQSSDQWIMVHGPWVRRYVHGHIRRRIRDLEELYSAQAACIRDEQSKERTWLSRASKDMEAMSAALSPWQVQLGSRLVTLLGVAASIAALVRGVELAENTVQDLLLGILALVAFAFYPFALFVGLGLRKAFLWKRRHFLEWDVYSLEDELFACLGVTKRPEPLTDFRILDALSAVIGAGTAAFLPAFDVDPLVSLGIGYFLFIGGILVTSPWELIQKKRRRPR